MSKLSKAEAVARGSRYYFTDLLCKNGHLAPRYTASGACMECSPVNEAKRKKYKRDWYARKAVRNYRSTVKGRATVLHGGAKQRARKRGLEFTITLDWVVSRLSPLVCEATGIKIDLSKCTKSRFGPWAPTLDRRNPKKGYTKQNTQLVCNMHNMAKGQWSRADLLKYARALLKNR